MKLIRLLGAVVILYGLSYLFHALLQIAGSILTASASMFRVHVIGLNLCIGTVTTIIGIGLILAKNWARIAWLVAVTVLVVQHSVILYFWYVRGSDLTSQLFNVGVTTCLALLSWAKLTNESTRKLFR